MSTSGTLDLSQDDVFKLSKQSFISDYEPINSLKYSFIAAVVFFIIFFPFFSSRKSFFDVIAVKKIMPVTRGIATLHMFSFIYLYYCLFNFGSPLPSTASVFTLAGSMSWIYFYTRPASGFLLAAAGLIADIHPAFRAICGAGCLLEIICGSISAFQVYDYFKQSANLSAPTGLYTTDLIYYFYIRDVISFGLSWLLLLNICYLTSILGLYGEQAISYALISGGDIDRNEIMRKQRDIRSNKQSKSNMNNNNGLFSNLAFPSTSAVDGLFDGDTDGDRDFEDEYSDSDDRRTVTSRSRLLFIYKVAVIVGTSAVGIYFLLVYLNVI